MLFLIRFMRVSRFWFLVSGCRFLFFRSCAHRSGHLLLATYHSLLRGTHPM